MNFFERLLRPRSESAEAWTPILDPAITGGPDSASAEARALPGLPFLFVLMQMYPALLEHARGTCVCEYDALGRIRVSCYTVLWYTGRIPSEQVITDFGLGADFRAFCRHAKAESEGVLFDHLFAGTAPD